MQVMAANGLSERVSVVHADAGMLQRGREVRSLGCRLAIADVFDAGMPSPHSTSCQDCCQPAMLLSSCRQVLP